MIRAKYAAAAPKQVSTLGPNVGEINRLHGFRAKPIGLERIFICPRFANEITQFEYSIQLVSVEETRPISWRHSFEQHFIRLCAALYESNETPIRMFSSVAGIAASYSTYILCRYRCEAPSPHSQFTDRYDAPRSICGADAMQARSTFALLQQLEFSVPRPIHCCRMFQ